MWASNVPRLEIYGSEGTLSVPDPNTFDGPVRLRKAGEDDWQEVPLMYGHTGNERGMGVADMAGAMRSGGPHRASGELAYHVLDIMHAFHDASEQGQHVDLESRGERPEPLPRAEKSEVQS